MLRISMAGPLVAAGLACALGVTRVEAQLEATPEYRKEITPFAGYQLGGSFETFANGPIPAGSLEMGDDFAWGGILGFMVRPRTFAELTYLRQDTDLSFDVVGGGARGLGGFAVNYIQVGGRQEFGTGSRIYPFLDFSLGLGIFDPKAEGVESDTRFSWSVGGGLRLPVGQSGRTSIRADGRLWVTPVPSGDYGVWCDFFGCFVAEGTAWVTQGTVSGGLTFAF